MRIVNVATVALRSAARNTRFNVISVTLNVIISR